MFRTWQPATFSLGLLGCLILGCAGPATRPANDAGQPEQVRQGGRTKAITIGITTPVPALSVAGPTTPQGGWMSLTEMHSDGLVTSEPSSRKPIGRLAEKAPSLDDGSVSILPDGRMRTVFNLRKGVTWHDGAPFTAQDLVFSYRMVGPEGVPSQFNTASQYMSSVEAPDDYTFVVHYKSGYYQGTILGPYIFWPLPRHLLEESFERFLISKNPDDVLNNPYWTSGYVHLGPFRLTEFDPGNQLTFQAFDKYFLGRPKLDVIYVRSFGSDTTLFSNVLAGAVDLVSENVFRNEGGPQLKNQWEGAGEGTVHVKQTSLRFLVPQVRPNLQMEATVLEPRGRIALLQALDREGLSEAVNGGNPQLAGWSILAQDDALYEATRDTLRVYPYSVDRARAILREAGWTAGSDGALRNSSDGRQFRTSIWSSVGSEREMAAYASYWRDIGLQVEEYTTSAAQTRDEQARAQFPGWDLTAGNVIGPMESPAAGPDNRWTGNRSGYEDPRAQQLARAFKSSISPTDQLAAMRRLNEFFIAELPALPTFYIANYIAVSKRLKALDDLAGAAGGNLPTYAYGGYARNAYLWDVQ